MLSANSEDNNLPGGVIGFDKKIWSAESFEADEAFTSPLISMAITAYNQASGMIPLAKLPAIQRDQ